MAWLKVNVVNESIGKFKFFKKDQKLLEGYPEMLEIECRLVRIELDNEEFEILCTSLTDLGTLPDEDIVELYHHR